MPDRISVPGAIVTGDSAGFVNVPKLKGIHYAMRSGMLAAEAVHEVLKAGGDPAAPGALDGYDRRVKASHIWRDLHRVRNMRQALTKGLVVGGGLASAMDLTPGRVPRRHVPHPARCRRRASDRGPRLSRAGRLAHVRQAVERLPLGEPQPRRPAQPHPHPGARPGRGGAGVGRDVPGRRLRAGRAVGRRHGRGEAHAVELRPVRCDHRQGRAAHAARRAAAAPSTRSSSRVDPQGRHGTRLGVSRLTSTIASAGILLRFAAARISSGDGAS